MTSVVVVGTIKIIWTEDEVVVLILNLCYG